MKSVYVLHNQSVKVLIILTTLSIINIVASLVQTGLSIRYVTLDHGCHLLHKPVLFVIGWYVPFCDQLVEFGAGRLNTEVVNRLLALIFDTVLIVFTLVSYRRNQDLDRSSILHVMVRHGAWAYACLFCKPFLWQQVSL